MTQEPFMCVLVKYYERHINRFFLCVCRLADMSQAAVLAVFTHAYLYLLREREFVLRGEDVYKIGLTRQQMDLKIKRFKGYKKGSELILVTECPLSVVEDVEKELKRVFGETFQNHADGTEYFVGNSRQMAKLIFAATDAAWTDDEQQKQANMLSRVFKMAETTHATPSAAQTKKVELAAKAEAKAQLAVAEAEKIKEEETHFGEWFADSCELVAEKFVKHATWYTNYRKWCSQTQNVPMSEHQATTTFKRLYEPSGVSVGNKTYGVQLKTLLSEAPPEVSDVPIVYRWLKGFVGSDVNMKRISAADLLRRYKDWYNTSEYNNLEEINVTKFGLELKKLKGIISVRSNGTKYTIDSQMVQYELSQQFKI